uniref:Uncharacterized protein n=1 Tax=Anguilla anguilla TaxID=7936 RepID=A0A0E9RPN4_ANGAN
MGEGSCGNLIHFCFSQLFHQVSRPSPNDSIFEKNLVVPHVKRLLFMSGFLLIYYSAE